MILLRLDLPQHFIVAGHEPFFLVAAVIMLRCYISGNGHNAAFYDSLKAEIKGGFIAPVYRGDDTDSFGCPVGAAPAVAEHIVKLHNRGHFQIHTEIRGKYGPVARQLFNVAVRAFPYPLKAVVIEEEMHHAVKVGLILQMRLIKPDQQEIVKVTRLFLKLWNDRDLQISLTG